MLSDWESDFIKGAGNQPSVDVLVKHPCRLALLAKMIDATAASVLAGSTVKFCPIARSLPQSVTHGQYKQMAGHQEFSDTTGIKFGLCGCWPSYWQHRSENTNGLLRQLLLKGINWFLYHSDELDAIADSLDDTREATPNFRAPIEVPATMRTAIAQLSTSIQ